MALWYARFSFFHWLSSNSNQFFFNLTSLSISVRITPSPGCHWPLCLSSWVWCSSQAAVQHGEVHSESNLPISKAVDRVQSTLIRLPWIVSSQNVFLRDYNDMYDRMTTLPSSPGLNSLGFFCSSFSYMLPEQIQTGTASSWHIIHLQIDRRLRDFREELQPQVERILVNVWRLIDTLSTI